MRICLHLSVHKEHFQLLSPSSLIYIQLSPSTKFMMPLCTNKNNLYNIQEKHSLNLVVFLAEYNASANVCLYIGRWMKTKRERNVLFGSGKNHKNKSVCLSAHKNGNRFFSILIFFIYFMLQFSPLMHTSDVGRTFAYIERISISVNEE